MAMSCGSFGHLSKVIAHHKIIQEHKFVYNTTANGKLCVRHISKKKNKEKEYLVALRLH